jgi:hypothetical protein
MSGAEASRTIAAFLAKGKLTGVKKLNLELIFMASFLPGESSSLVTQRIREMLEESGNYSGASNTKLIDSHINKWMSSKIPALANKTPIQVLGESDGEDRIYLFLNQMEAGVYL